MQQTRQQTATAANSSIFGKIRVSQPDGLQAAMITIFYTQVLDLGMVILVNVAVNPAML